MKLTKKQKFIMVSVFDLVESTEDGDVIYPDIDMIMEDVPYEVSKPAFIFSLRYLINKGLLKKCGKETRRKKSRTLVSPTVLAFDLYRNI